MLRVETREVELVQLPQVGAIACIYIVEPVHELVGDVLAEHLVEPLRQSCGDRHPGFPPWPVGNVRLCAASRVIEVLQEGADSRRVYARRPRRVKRAPRCSPGWRPASVGWARARERRVEQLLPEPAVLPEGDQDGRPFPTLIEEELDAC